MRLFLFIFPQAGVHKELIRCMNRVVLRGCEAEYLGEFIRTTEICPAREKASESTDMDSGHSSSSSHGQMEEASSEHWQAGEIEDGDSLLAVLPSPSLVMHIRSGDVFGKRRINSRYGQVSERRW